MSLPVDRSRTYRRSDYPKVPGLYRPLRHFIQRFKEDERHLSGEIIRRCLTYGEVRDNNDGTAVFRLPYHGVAYYIVAGFHEDGYRVLVTGWPHLHSRDVAEASGYWNEEQIDEIASLNARYQDGGFAAEYPQYHDWIQQQ